MQLAVLATAQGHLPSQSPRAPSSGASPQAPGESQPPADPGCGGYGRSPLLPSAPRSATSPESSHGVPHRPSGHSNVLWSLNTHPPPVPPQKVTFSYESGRAGSLGGGSQRVFLFSLGVRTRVARAPRPFCTRRSPGAAAVRSARSAALLLRRSAAARGEVSVPGSRRKVPARRFTAARGARKGLGRDLSLDGRPPSGHVCKRGRADAAAALRPGGGRLRANFRQTVWLRTVRAGPARLHVPTHSFPAPPALVGEVREPWAQVVLSCDGSRPVPHSGLSSDVEG